MSTVTIDTVVRSGPVPIAVRDHGGEGRPLLLLHGGGGNLLMWEAVAPLLARSHRVVAMDLRGHGRSGDGPWAWAGVLDDLAAVADQSGLDNPVVVGHSLGGIIAGLWARRHPECPAVVSLDGHRSSETRPENYAGLPDDRARADLARLSEMFTAQAQMMAQPLTDEQVDMVLAGQRAAAARYGVDEEKWLEVTRRNLTTKDGATRLRPGPEVTSALREAPEFVDALPAFGDVTAPMLVVLATRNLPELPPEFGPLMDALRDGLRRDFATLSASRPNIRVTELDATHGMVFEQPERIARLVTEFVTEVAVTPTR